MSVKNYCYNVIKSFFYCDTTPSFIASNDLTNIFFQKRSRILNYSLGIINFGIDMKSDDTIIPIPNLTLRPYQFTFIFTQDLRERLDSFINDFQKIYIYSIYIN